MQRTGLKINFLIWVFFAMSLHVHAYDMSRYARTSLDDFLTQTPPVKNLTLVAPRKLRVAAYLAGFARTCNTDILQAALTLQGAPRDALDNVSITQCIHATSLLGGHTIPMYIQDRVANHLPKEATIGARITLYVDYLYQGANGPGLLVNEFELP
ncbi:MAG: hypothetical protein AABY83_14170 [Pseudomonadota bacterium]